MRFAILVVSVLFAGGVAPAAPVPADSKVDRQKLEALWGDLESTDLVVRTKAMFALIDHPKAVAFLSEKLPPVKESAEQLRSLLTDLNSDDEQVWKAAFEKLRYHDPRTELTAAEQVGLMNTDNGRRLLASVWWGWLLELRPDTVRTSLTPQVGSRWYMFHEYQNRGASGVGVNPAPVGEIASPTWQRAAVAAAILRRIGTDTSRAVLEKLATGHQDALPTRTAVELLKAKPSAGMTEKRFATAWAELLQVDPYSKQQVAIARELIALAGAPESAAMLKTKLPAIKADKEQVSKWLKALDSEDEKTWKPAFEQLLYFRPLLALSWKEQCDAVTTDHGRSALFHLWGATTGVPDRLDIYPDAELTPREGGLTLRYTHGQVGGGLMTTWVTPGELATLAPTHWQRARLAILALERMKTAEAKAVLTQLADGHPDILPTKEAKAALKRLEGK